MYSKAQKRRRPKGQRLLSLIPALADQFKTRKEKRDFACGCRL